MVTPLMFTLANATLNSTARHMDVDTHNDNVTLSHNLTTVSLPMATTKFSTFSSFAFNNLTSTPGPSTANFTTASVTPVVRNITSTEATPSTTVTTLTTSTLAIVSTTTFATTTVPSTCTISPSVIIDSPGESYHILAIFVTALFIATVLLIIKIISSHNNKRRVIMSWWQPSSSSSYNRSGPAAVYTAASDPQRQVSSMDIPDTRFDWERQFFDEDAYTPSREFDFDLSAEEAWNGKQKCHSGQANKVGFTSLAVM
uniref:Uncharacterized protein n=1 Tax=Syphacia muris TaxID=451379 RepID=A0A0N5APY3_9BILA